MIIKFIYQQRVKRESLRRSGKSKVYVKQYETRREKNFYIVTQNYIFNEFIYIDGTKKVNLFTHIKDWYI